MDRCAAGTPKTVTDIDKRDTRPREGSRKRASAHSAPPNHGAVKACVCVLDRDLPRRKRFPYKCRQAITRLASTNAHAVHMPLVITRFQQTSQSGLVNRAHRRGVKTKVALKPLH